MARYTTSIDKLNTDRTGINNALESKEAGQANTFSEIADKIRGIETGGQYNVIVDFGSHYGGSYYQYIAFSIKENNSSGKELISINERKHPSEQSQYTYSFSTDANTIYIESQSFYSTYDTSTGIGKTITLTDLKKHKTIKIVTTNSGFNATIQYAD